MDVGDVVLGIAGGATFRDRVALLDTSAASHEERPEMRQRRFMAARGDDGDRHPVRGHMPGKGDFAGDGRANDRRATERDVDPAVLTAGVRVVADGVAPEHGAFPRPRPRERVGGTDQPPGERGQRSDQQSGCPMR